MPSQQSAFVRFLKKWRDKVLNFWGALDIVTVVIEGEIFPVLSFGLREERRVGSMDAGSDVLRLTTTSQFVAGEKVIVEIGGEAGAGLIGTVGVGGFHAATDAGQYYRAQISPKSLKATVVSTDPNGGRLVLNTPATVATVNANVYFDCTDIIVAKLAETHAGPFTLTFPTGEFAVSSRMLHDSQDGWTIEGAGQDDTIFMSPKGVPSASMSFFDSDQMIYRDFQVKGNWKQNGFGLATFPPTFFPSDVPAGMYGHTTSNSVVERVKCVDVGMKGAWFDFAIGCSATDCTTILTDVHRFYYSPWFYGCGDSTNCTFDNCRVESESLISGFETFRSTGAVFVDCVGINAVFSSNSSGNFTFNNCSVTIAENSWFDTASFSHTNPIFNINSNISPPDTTMQFGGAITDCDITVAGPIGNANNDFLKGIVVNVDNPHIRINGGTLSYPVAIVGQEIGPFAIISTAEDCDVRNVTCLGAVEFPSFQANVNLSRSPGDAGQVDNVIGSVILNSVVVTGGRASGKSRVTGVSA